MTPAEPGRRRGPSAAHWTITLALILLLLVGCGALGPLLRGSAWWWLMAFVAAVVLAASAVLRRVGVFRSLVPIAALGVLLATLTLLFGAGSGLLWLIPTQETLDRFQDLIGAGATSIASQSTPAEVTDGILFLLAAGVGLIAVFMDILAAVLRWPALAGLPVLVPVAVPGLLVDGGADPVALVLAAGAYLLLLRVDVRLRRAIEADHPPVGLRAPRTFAPASRRGPGPVWGAVTVGSIGIVSALLLSVAAPALTAGGPAGRSPGTLFGAGVSPLINLGQDLRRPPAGPALHYKTTADELPYFTLLTLDRFVGVTWTARPGPANRANTVDHIARPPGLSSRVATTVVRTAIEIDGVDTNLLPAPAPATRITGLTGDWYWDSRTRTVSSPDSTTIGQDYVVTGLELAPTRDQLRDSGRKYPVSVTPSLDLPAEVPRIIGQTARTVTGDSASAYDSAVALQDYLRGSDFVYDTEAPVEDGYDGGGIDVVATFLDVKRGYCVHFASAMAVMARSIGIPSRIAIGYLPGSRSENVVNGLDRYEVDSHDLHAWPELYFVGIGWVPFEPTPGRGTVPDYARPAEAAPSGGPGAAPATNTARPGRDTPGGDQGQGGSSAGTAGAVNLLGLGGALALVAVALLAPAVLRRVRRARRLRRIRSGTGGPQAAWAELADTALDHGARVSDTETPRELAGRVATLIAPSGPDGAAAVDRLLVAVERLRYDRPAAGATPAGPSLARDLERVIRALHGAAEPRVRWRATLVPASLFTAVLGGVRQRNGRSPRDA